MIKRLLSVFLLIFFIFALLGNVFGAETIAQVSEKSPYESSSDDVIDPKDLSEEQKKTLTDEQKRNLANNVYVESEGKILALNLNDDNDADLFFDPETDIGNWYDSKEEATLSAKLGGNDYKEVYSTCNTNPSKCTTSTLATLNEYRNKVELDKEYSPESSLLSNLKAKQAAYDSATDPEEKEKARKELANAEEKYVEGSDPEKATSVISSPEGLEAATRALENKECGTGWTSSVCKLLTRDIVEDRAKQETFSRLKNEWESGNLGIEEYNKELASDFENEIGQFITADSEEIDCDTINSCVDQLSSYNCGDDTNCQTQKDILLAKGEAYQDAKRVETSGSVFSLLQTLKGDDRANTVMRAFGPEADYKRVPVFLRNLERDLTGMVGLSVCEVKLDGYLSGQTSAGVSTQYRCSDEDEQGNYTQCNQLGVVSDLRAMRTQVRPDGTTAITYSVFLNKDYISGSHQLYLGVSYKINGQTKKVILKQNEKNSTLVDGSSTLIRKMTYPLELNETDISKIDEKMTLSLALVSTSAQKSDGPSFMDSVDIQLIKRGDYYSLNLGSGNSYEDDSSSGGTSSESPDPFTSQDFISIMN